jgi:hypothetical protein
MTAAGSPDLFGDPASVTECLAIMATVSQEQRARARHLDAKTGTLAGFTGAMLALTAVLGNSTLQTEASETATLALRAFFVVTILAFAVSALVALRGVLMPMGHADLKEAQIDAYSDLPKITTPPDQLRETWLATLTLMAISDRKAGERKATASKVAGWALLVGLVGIVLQALTLAVIS